MKRLTLLCAAFAAAQTALAGNTPLILDDVTVVTATRTATPVDETLSTITIFSRDDIERSQADRLPDVLRFMPGLDVVRTGGPGQQTSLFLRGSESNHTLVLIDGVRMNPATIGGAAVQNVPVSIIERIEVVTGPRSSLYGSDAIGGVINIITRRDGEGGELMGRYGGDNQQTLAANVGFGQDQWAFRAGVDSQRTGGIPTRTFTNDDRGYENDSFNLSVNRSLTRGNLTLRHVQAEGVTEYADFFGTPVAQDFENAVTALEWQQQFAADWDSTLIISRNFDDIAQQDSPDFVESTRTTVDWQNTVRLSDAHTLVAGVFAFQESARSESFGLTFDEDTDLTAVFVQDQYRVGRFDAIGALRFTEHDAFGSEVTWNAAVGFEVTPTLRLQASGGRAFRAPDATDRFGFGGDPELEAEISRQWQAAAVWRPTDTWRVSFELFRNDIEDLIDFDFATFTLQNIAEAEIRGAEFRAAWARDGLRVALGLLAQSVEDGSTGERLLRRSERSATLDASYELGDFDVSLSVRADGDRAGIGFPDSVRLAGYVLVNSGVRYRLNERWQLAASVENLLDADYEPAADFRAQDRRTSISLRYTW